MKHVYIAIFICFSITFEASAQVNQEWIRTLSGSIEYSEDFINSMVVDQNGNIYVTGSISEFENPDIVTIKYNTTGDQLWIKYYNGPGNSNDYGSSIAIDQSGNIYIAGISLNKNERDYVVIKYDSYGAKTWVKKINGPGNENVNYSSMVVDNNGNIYITGNSNELKSSDIVTIKYNTNGEQEWLKKFNVVGNSNDYGISLALDQSDNVYITGGSSYNNVNEFVTIKYNNNGILQWNQRFNGFGAGRIIKIDVLGNVYVTGNKRTSFNNDDYLTIKYNNNGIEQWYRIYDGPVNGNDNVSSMVLDNLGNVYLTGYSLGIGTAEDYATVKYNPNGNEEWVQRFNGTGNSSDAAFSIVSDLFNNVYVTGISSQNNYTTIKYNTYGVLEWIQNTYGYNGLPNFVPNAVDVFNNVYIAGTIWSDITYHDCFVAKYSQQQFALNQPTPYAKWISGEISTISWEPLPWANVNIKCLLDFGTSSQTEIPIASNISVTQTEYPWLIPENTLSYKSKIVIENAANPTQKIESDIFRIKPYLLTRVNPDSTYYEYRKNRDQWGFWNQGSQMWPFLWYVRFNYLIGIDPFTNMRYSLSQGDKVFLEAKMSDFPDWISFVNTFTINECYKNLSQGIYSEFALSKWKEYKKSWEGSCFGIAIANSLVFSNKNAFFTRYPDFPTFTTPVDIQSSNEVRKIINELFTHQFIGTHREFRYNANLNKTPNETLEDIKNMLITDSDPQRILAFESNNGYGSHVVNVISVKQDNFFSNIYRVQIYDSNNPELFSVVIIDTDANNGNGTWSYPLIDYMSGDSRFYLMDSSLLYLNIPSDDNNTNISSSGNLIQIFSQYSQDILIYDNLGNKSGISNDSIYLRIPGSTSETIPNGVEIPPYSYLLNLDNYQISISNFINDTAHIGMYLNNKSFSYDRQSASQFQTDKLYFDGALSASNPDTSVKTIQLSNIVDEATQEKVFAFSSIDLAQNDSVKIENLGSDNFKLTSYGTTKNYDIELTFVSQSQIGRFMNINILLPSNSSHTFIPNWNNVTTSQLVILQDIGNNGTIDDTIRVNNIITDLEEGTLIIPDKYSLAQNYPNPFNPSTKIKYDIKIDGLVTLKIYNILGMEVASLVNEVKQAGRYEAEFNGFNLGSGIYYYRLEAGEFTETRKMLLLK